MAFLAIARSYHEASHDQECLCGSLCSMFTSGPTLRGVMEKVTMKRVQDVLSRRLRLQTPHFDLERLTGGKISGSVVSDTFKRKRHDVRQRMIWNALDEEFGQESARFVGTLLAYTDAEWNVDLQ